MEMANSRKMYTDENLLVAVAATIIVDRVDQDSYKSWNRPFWVRPSLGRERASIWRERTDGGLNFRRCDELNLEFRC